MMKFLSRSDSKKEERSHAASVGTPVSYESAVTIDSKVMPGVKFVVNRISFGRRMELSRRVREITQKVEFLEAGNELDEKIEAAMRRADCVLPSCSWPDGMIPFCRRN